MNLGLQPAARIIFAASRKLCEANRYGGSLAPAIFTKTM